MNTTVLSLLYEDPWPAFKINRDENKYKIWNCSLLFCNHTKAQIIARMMIPVVVPPMALNNGEPILNVSCPKISGFQKISAILQSKIGNKIPIHVKA